MQRLNVKIVMCILALIIIALAPFFTVSAKANSSASGMAVIEINSGRVLYTKNEFKRLPMASTTKIATAITVIENCNDLSKTVSVPDCAVGVEGSSIYLKAGEKVKIIDLLYGLMLQSGNDCAVALAVTVFGSIENCAKKMNETAVKAGATKSNFVNPHGLHDENHYTTALDLALISSYALKNDTFSKIVSTKRYEMQNDENKRVIVNKNKLLSSFLGATGVKTGFTKKAGRCLVSSACRNGMHVVAVVLNCGPMFEECATLMNRAFDEFSLKDVSYDKSVTINVTGAKQSKVSAITNEKVFYPIKNDGSEAVEYEVCDVKSLDGAHKIGTEVGKIKITLKKQLLFEQKLYTIEEVLPLGVCEKIGEVIKKW